MKRRLKSIFGGSSPSLNSIEENSNPRPNSSSHCARRSPTLCMLESQSRIRFNEEDHSQHDDIKRKYVSASDSVCLHTSCVDLDDLFDTVFDDDAAGIEQKSPSSQIRFKQSPISGSLRSLTLSPFPWFSRSNRSSSTRREENDVNHNLTNNGITSGHATPDDQQSHTLPESPSSSDLKVSGKESLLLQLLQVVRSFILCKLCQVTRKDSKPGRWKRRCSLKFVTIPLTHDPEFEATCILVNKRTLRLFAYGVLYLSSDEHQAALRSKIKQKIDRPRSSSLVSLRSFTAFLGRPECYKEEILFSYQHLYKMTILKPMDAPLDLKHLARFYVILHQTLRSSDQDLVNKILRSSCQFFASCLHASHLLLLDFIHACRSVAAASDLKAPRLEVQTILRSALCFSNIHHNALVLKPDCQNLDASECTEIKDAVIEILLTSARKEPSSTARCVALANIGLWLFEELSSQHQRHCRVEEAINILLVSLKFHNYLIANVACSQLHLLTHCSVEMMTTMPELTLLLIEVISLTISLLLNVSEVGSSQSGKRLIISLLFCLLDWCMGIPMRVLTDAVGVQSKRRLITTIFKTLQRAASGKQTNKTGGGHVLSDLTSKDFDPNLPLENMQDILPTGISVFNKVSSNKSSTARLDKSNEVSLVAQTILGHLTNHLGHFPLTQDPSLITSLVSEHHDVTDVVDDLDPSLFDSGDVQFLVINNSCLLSVQEIPAEKEKSYESPNVNKRTPIRSVRFIVRNISGKHCWESTMLYEPQNATVNDPCVKFKPPSMLHQNKHHTGNELSTCVTSTQVTEKPNMTASSMPSHHTNLSKSSCDKLDQLLQYIDWSSPECQRKTGIPLNFPSKLPTYLSPDAQSNAIQRMLKYNENLASTNQGKVPFVSCQRSAFRCQDMSDFHKSFHQARLLCSNLNYLSFDDRHQMNLLKKNERLLRELKNLDSRRSRETHKVAVFYIAKGQEDKLSILSNTSGSEEYENFVAGLGWEVDLTSHSGFRGKLQSDGSNGATAPYYATSTIEVIYHVATRFPSSHEAAKNVKIRHLGNDEVHIVWSDHHRDYRRGIIPTEFGDVLIVIYPIHLRLFRVQIIKKPEIPYFGPLFNGALVTARVLPVLVRETAINAGRAKRSLINLYQSFYEERSRYLDQIISNFKEERTFEDFSAQFLSPCPQTKDPKKKKKSSLQSGKSIEVSITVSGTTTSLPNSPSFGNVNNNNNNNNSIKSASKSPFSDISKRSTNTLQIPSRRKHSDAAQVKSSSTVSSFLSRRFLSSPALNRDSQTSPSWKECGSPFQKTPFFIFPNLTAVTSSSSSSDKITTKHQ